MPQLIAIADDLTGAAEIAGAALRLGLSAEVQIAELYPSAADVVVIDADSRSATPEAAFEKVQRLAMQANASGAKWVFKKVDSLLRGPVMAEIAAMQGATNLKHCLLVCSNPRKRRTLVAGQIQIEGVPLEQTAFANDPEHPRYTSHVRELLLHGLSSWSQFAREVQIIAPEDDIDFADNAGDAFTIGNASTVSDLDRYAGIWKMRQCAVLAAGSAEFFEAILRQCFEGCATAEPEGRDEHETTEAIQGEVLLISGTSLSHTHGFPLIKPIAGQPWDELENEVCRTLASAGRAAIRAADFGMASSVERLHQLASIVGPVLAKCRPGEVWIEGGRTASLLIRELGYQRLLAVANRGDGVVALRSPDEWSPIYLIKPGSYPWKVKADDREQAEKVVRAPMMKSIKWLWLFVVCWMSCATRLSRADEHEAVATILQDHCLDCHDSVTHQGGVNLQSLLTAGTADRDRSQWKHVFDVVEAGQMPLHDSGYTLDDLQRQRLLTFARNVLSKPDVKLQAIDPGKPILRRLTRLEYNNTLRDLFGLNFDIIMFPERLPIADKRYFLQSPSAGVPLEKSNMAVSRLGDVIRTSMREYGQKYEVLLPTHGLPGDNRAENGYSNRGDVLNFSPLLFEKYLELAAAIVSSERLRQESPVWQSLLGIQQVSTQPTSKALEVVPAADQVAAKDRIGTQASDNDTQYDRFVAEFNTARANGRSGTFDVPPSLANQTVVGKSGQLKLLIGDQPLTIRADADLWLASFATAEETSGDLLFTNRIKGMKQFELSFEGEGNSQPQVQQLAVCVLARKNQRGAVKLTATLSNGQKRKRQALVDQSTDNLFFSWVAPAGTSIQKLAIDGAEFSGDYILLDDLAFVLESSRDFVSQSTASTATPERKTSALTVPPLPERIQGFLRRAYRRELTPQELEDTLALVHQSMQQGKSEEQALRRWVQAVLTSPEFLYLAESVDDQASAVRRLSSAELANRLSYFLWSSMPDEELLTAAQSNALHDPVQVRSQVQRMLAKRSHSRELSESFATQWLRLDQLYSSKPDRELFKRFYAGPQGKSTMHGPMMTEALLLFETILVEDRSVLELFDADFTWLNAQLAKLYSLDEAYQNAVSAATTSGQWPSSVAEKEAGQYWVRTALPDRTRGGVITMAGPLTLTSLPFRTSPIKRGAWLLETVFNRPPREPKVAFVLEETTAVEQAGNTAQTVRQAFEKHRSDPNCFSCHSRIDPPGFSLEVFDAMGVLRTHDGDQLVDASGVWNERAFASPAEFKDAIRAREQELVRGFVEHLTSYALGRQLQHYDVPAIDKIVNDARQDGYRLSSVIEGIVLSYPFQYVRNGQ